MKRFFLITLIVFACAINTTTYTDSDSQQDALNLEEEDATRWGLGFSSLVPDRVKQQITHEVTNYLETQDIIHDISLLEPYLTQLAQEPRRIAEILQQPNLQPIRSLIKGYNAWPTFIAKPTIVDLVKQNDEVKEAWKNKIARLNDEQRAILRKLIKTLKPVIGQLAQSKEVDGSINKAADLINDLIPLFSDELGKMRFVTPVMEVVMYPSGLRKLGIIIGSLFLAYASYKLYKYATAPTNIDDNNY